MKTNVAELEFAVDGSKLIGLWPVSPTCSMLLGEELIGGTLTGALRQFNLQTARAPGDWPEPTVNGTIRF